MSENKPLFREKSLEQFSSPEQLNDYIRVASPSIFLLLGAVIVFLIGVVIWSLTGTIQSTIDVNAVVNKGILTAYVPQREAADMDQRSTVSVNGNEYAISTVSNAMRAADVLDSDQLAVYELNPNDMVYAVSSETTLPDGSYAARVIVKKLRPADLILN
jgi:hypothetical protein